MHLGLTPRHGHQHTRVNVSTETGCVYCVSLRTGATHISVQRQSRDLLHLSQRAPCRQLSGGSIFLSIHRPQHSGFVFRNDSSSAPFAALASNYLIEIHVRPPSPLQRGRQRLDDGSSPCSPWPADKKPGPKNRHVLGPDQGAALSQEHSDRARAVFV